MATVTRLRAATTVPAVVTVIAALAATTDRVALAATTVLAVATVIAARAGTTAARARTEAAEP